MDELLLESGERIIQKTQGSIQLVGLKWQPGNLFLTNRRLVFKQAAKILLECCLNKIININTMKRIWIMGLHINQMCIEIDRGSRRQHICFAIDKPVEWADKTKESIAIMLAERRVCNGGKPESSGNT